MHQPESRLELHLCGVELARPTKAEDEGIRNVYEREGCLGDGTVENAVHVIAEVGDHTLGGRSGDGAQAA
jgi:hypothetical protein